jgi:FAD/FMN-containing dehydrogenase
MSSSITNYDGGIVTTPRVHVKPQSVEQLQEISARHGEVPRPRACHGQQPLAHAVRRIDRHHHRHDGVEGDSQDRRAGHDVDGPGRPAARGGVAGAAQEEAAVPAEHRDRQHHARSAACCHTKDALDGVELGQLNSYVTSIKWVSPSGTLEEASTEKNANLLPLIRASYGLAGVVYEVTFKIKPLEIVKFDYHIHKVDELTDEIIAKAIASNQAMVMWTVDDEIVIQTRNAATELKHEWLANARRFGWNFLGAFAGRGLREHLSGEPREYLEDRLGDIEIGFYRLLSAAGGFTLNPPDKTVDYSKTKRSARYAFTFWAFPRADFVKNLQDYVKWADSYYERYGFRCNMPLGSYFIHQDRSSLLSYTWDGDVISLDPIHAPGEKEQGAWADFLKAFNEWAHERGGIPLLNQSPFVRKPHVLSAYGDRWTQLAGWLATVDPNRRMVNEFFEALLP